MSSSASTCGSSTASELGALAHTPETSALPVILGNNVSYDCKTNLEIKKIAIK